MLRFASVHLSFLVGKKKMLIGYMRVSKNDGSQTLDLQRDALIAAGVAKKGFIRIMFRVKKIQGLV